MQGDATMHATLWFCVPEIGERIIAGDSRKDIEARRDASDAASLS